MTYVITDACVDLMDRSCLDECPVDCIYEGGRRLYISPAECIDCGACEVVCPHEAIVVDRAATGELAAAKADQAAFFAEVLPGRDAPLGSPGGARRTGPIGVDVPRVRGL